MEQKYDYISEQKQLSRLVLVKHKVKITHKYTRFLKINHTMYTDFAK